MQNVFSILGLVVSDKFIFPIFEILFLLLIFYAIAKDIKFRRGRGIIAVIKRGEESWKNLYISYGVASVIVMQIISVSDSLKNYKVVISLFDLGVLLYLTFFNAWFRNKIIGIIISSKTMKERR